MIFVDTAAFLALLDTKDEYHDRARTTWEDLLHGSEGLASNNYTLVESIFLVQRRLGIEAVRILQTRIAPFLLIEWCTEEQHDSAVKLILSANRRGLSLVDHSAFETMRRLGMRTAFTFDSHFREQGFTVIP